MVRKAVKFPINLQNIGYKMTKLLAVYLAMKRQANSGLITHADLRPFRYYKERLTAMGLLTKDRSGLYRLRRYAAVWRILGIEKTYSNNGRYKKVFCNKIEDELLTKKEMEERLFQHQADTLGAQIKYVRNAGKRKNKKLTIEAPLSSRTVAEHLGYKQPSTGSRKRKKYFKLSNAVSQEKFFRYVPEINLYRWQVLCKTRTVLL